VGSPILRPCSFALPGLCYPKLPPLRTADSPWDKPLRLGIHRHLRSPPGHARPLPTPGLHSPAGAPFCWAVPTKPYMISALPATCPRPAQPCTIFTPQACAPKACQARDPHMHDLCSAGLCPPKPVKPGIYRHAGSPLHWPVPYRHAKPRHQRPATSPQLKTSTHRPVGPPPTIHLPQEGSKLT
jgi:hypothetical protein